MNASVICANEATETIWRQRMTKCFLAVLLIALPVSGYPSDLDKSKERASRLAAELIKEYSILIEYSHQDKAYGNVYRVIKPFYEQSTRDGCCDVNVFVKHIYSIEGGSKGESLSFKPAKEAIPGTDISSLYIAKTIKLEDAFIPKDYESMDVMSPMVFTSLYDVVKEKMKKRGLNPEILGGVPAAKEIDLSKNKSISLCQTVARGDGTMTGMESESYIQEELTYLGYEIDWDCSDAYNWFSGNI